MGCRSFCGEEDSKKVCIPCQAGRGCVNAAWLLRIAAWLLRVAACCCELLRVAAYRCVLLCVE